MNLANLENVQSLELGTLLHVFAFLMVAAHCLRLPREPRSTLLWLFVTGFFPIIGPFTYLAFGINHVPRRGWHKLRSDVRFGSTRSQTEQEEQPPWRWLQSPCPACVSWLAQETLTASDRFTQRLWTGYTVTAKWCG